MRHLPRADKQPMFLAATEQVFTGEIVRAQLLDAGAPLQVFAAVGIMLAVPSVFMAENTPECRTLRCSFGRSLEFCFYVGNAQRPAGPQRVRNLKLYTQTARRYGFYPRGGRKGPDARVTIHPPAELVAMALRYGCNDNIQRFLMEAFQEPYPYDDFNAVAVHVAGR